MKKAHYLFLYSIFSLQVYCSAQEQEMDYPAIKEYVTNHNTEFKSSCNVLKNDTLLTRQDHAMLYYGIHSHQLTKEVWMIFRIFKLIKEKSMKMLIISAKNY